MSQGHKQARRHVPLKNNGRAVDFGLMVGAGLLAGFFLGTQFGVSIALLLVFTANAYQEKRRGAQGAGAALMILMGAWVILAVIIVRYG